MEASFRTIIGWILASLLIFASLRRSEAFSWTEPENPTIVVEGVNSARVSLVWNPTFDSDETITLLTIKRGRPSSNQRDLIAAKSGENAFDVKPGFGNDYIANLPLTLVLLNVDNSEEYIYFVELSYSSNSQLVIKNSQVRVIVNVPPRITVVPPRQPQFIVGTNYTLTCNASGDPHPKILWTKEGVEAKDYNVSDYRLHLLEVDRTDVGSYKCTASNGYGNATSLAVVSVKCPTNRCQDAITVGITIKDDQWPWKSAYNNRDSIEYKMLQSNLTSAIASVYTKNPDKQLYEQAITELRPGSIVVHVQLLFGSGVNDPLKPLQDEVAKRTLGPFTVEPLLVENPTNPPPTTATGETTTGSEAGGPDAGARTNSGLTDAEMWGIIGGCIAFLLVIVIIILIICCCYRDRCCRGGATKSKSYSEADGYRMNKQPPSSGLGTASPAYVEARMYAPANASSRQDDQQTPIHYTEPSFDKSSGKPPPPRYGSGTEYSEMSPEKRPPPAGGGGQGEGGFELWC